MPKAIVTRWGHHYLEPELERPACRQVVAGPRDDRNRTVQRGHEPRAVLLGEFWHAEDGIDTSHAGARPVMGCSATSLAPCYTSTELWLQGPAITDIKEARVQRCFDLGCVARDDYAGSTCHGAGRAGGDDEAEAGQAKKVVVAEPPPAPVNSHAPVVSLRALIEGELARITGQKTRLKAALKAFG